MAMNDASGKLQLSEQVLSKQSTSEQKNPQSNNEKDGRSQSIKKINPFNDLEDNKSKKSGIQGASDKQISSKQIRLNDQYCSEGKGQMNKADSNNQISLQDRNYYSCLERKVDSLQENEMKCTSNQLKQHQQLEKAQLGKNDKILKEGGELTELSKQVLLLNYIYDNSLEQIRKINIQTMQLNYLEEFKHVKLDQRISPLILASYLGRLEIIKWLLQNKNIDIDFPSDVMGMTPLSAACMGGFYEVSELLIKKGADVLHKDKRGHSPFYFCFSRLEEDSCYFENKRICMKLADLLLDHGANIDEIVNEEKGFTMFMIFCHIKVKLNPRETDSNFSIIRYLLEHGSDSTRISKKGKDIFQILSKHPNKEALVALIQKNDDKRTTSDDHFSKEVKLISQQPYRIKIPEEDCHLEGITRQSSTCCNIFSFF